MTSIQYEYLMIMWIHLKIYSTEIEMPLFMHFNDVNHNIKSHAI